MSVSQFGSSSLEKSIARRNVTDVMIGDFSESLESPERMIGDLYLVVAMRMACFIY